MLIADSLAALGTIAFFCLMIAGRLEIWHIYLVNAIVGCSNAFQQPASSVAVFRLVPEEKLEMVSGMNSFSMNLVTIASPVLAAFCYGVFGMGSVLLIDIVSFMAAFLVLLFLIKIEEEKDTVQKTSLFSGTTQGWQFLWKNRGLLVMMLTMAAINFFSRLTYENILSPMILARSGENNMVLGLVNAAMGIGGIADGIIVTMKKETKNRVRMMSGAPIVPILEKLVGTGVGSGMACMFLCTGTLGFIISCVSYKNKDIQALNEIE